MKKNKVEVIELLDLTTVNFDLTTKWPYADKSVKEVNCSHKLEYIPGKLRIPVLEEAWRVLEDGGKLNVVVAYWTSPRSIQDPLTEWPPFCEQSFLYFNKGWREQNLLPPIKCDFDFTYGYQMDTDAAGRSAETQSFWVKHYLNTVLNLQLALVKRPL